MKQHTLTIDQLRWHNFNLNMACVRVHTRTDDCTNGLLIADGVLKSN